MDAIADELRRDPRHVEGHLAIAFRQLQRHRRPDLSTTESFDLFAVWHDRDRGQQVIDDAERAARFDALCDERDVLFSARERFPEHRAEMTTARLYEIGLALAELEPTFPAAPLGEWM